VPFLLEVEAGSGKQWLCKKARKERRFEDRLKVRRQKEWRKTKDLVGRAKKSK
jgi:hypothetical protein